MVDIYAGLKPEIEHKTKSHYIISQDRTEQYRTILILIGIIEPTYMPIRAEFNR